LRPGLARQRAAAAGAARLIIFPNETRARIAQAELGFSLDRLRIVWNLPRRAELPPLAPTTETPLTLHYHGGIAPGRLPAAVVGGVKRFGGRVRLRIVGRETPGALGYMASLLERGNMKSGEGVVEYIGQMQRNDLMIAAAQAHVGLALMPVSSEDMNMRNMTGASNKAFDYMAAGLALLVSDMADWREMFVGARYACACDPADPDSVEAVVRWFLDHADERFAMGMRGRAKIEADWNYDSAFAPILAALSDG
jgi:glycosyltransferase involved in cell wall biosynthesis